jgi:hypothetical protein
MSIVAGDQQVCWQTPRCVVPVDVCVQGRRSRTSGAPSDEWHNYRDAEHLDELCALEPY